MRRRWVTRSYVAVTGGSLNNASFTGQTANYVKLDKYFLDLDATAVSFDGKTGAAMTPRNWLRRKPRSPITWTTHRWGWSS